MLILHREIEKITSDIVFLTTLYLSENGKVPFWLVRDLVEWKPGVL